MSHYLNIYAVPKKEPKEPILLFDVSAGEDYWDLYSLFNDYINPAYAYDKELSDDKVKYSTLDASQLDEIIENLEKYIIQTRRQIEAYYKIGQHKPEETVMEIVRAQEYLDDLTRQKTGIEFLKFILERASEDYNPIEKFVCNMD